MGMVYDNGEAVSSLVQQMRTTKALPMTLKCPAQLSNKGVGRPKTCYDQDFILITETQEEVDAVLERVKDAIKIPNVCWNNTFYGKVL